MTSEWCDNCELHTKHDDDGEGGLICTECGKRFYE